MADLLDNPVINSPFEEPRRHFRCADSGIIDEIVAGRRRSTYFILIAKLKLESDIKKLYHRKILCRDPLIGFAGAMECEAIGA